MCRNIRTLFNYDPPATELEIHESTAMQIYQHRYIEQSATDRAIAGRRPLRLPAGSLAPPRWLLGPHRLGRGRSIRDSVE